MTELCFCWPGKVSAPYAQVGVTEYLSRIDHYRKSRTIVVGEERGRKYSVEHRLDREAQGLLARIGELGPAWVVALDPAGQQLTTRAFAKTLRRQLYEDTRTVVFVVGGPNGLSSLVRERADLLLGLSRMTLPHDMARLLLTEQVYRALTIIHGHPYDR